MPVAATDHGGGFVADREPGLGPLSGIKVDRSPLAAHLRSHPAGIDRIAQDARPAPRQRESERGDVQLAFGIGPSRIPRPLDPVDVAQRPLTTPMESTAEVDQPMGTIDQRREQVRSEGVHGEYGGMALRGRAAAFLAVNASVVDDRVHASDRVNLTKSLYSQRFSVTPVL